MRGKKLAGAVFAVTATCIAGCVSGPINIGALLNSASTNTQPAQAASPVPISTASAPVVEKRITFTEGYIPSNDTWLTGISNQYILGWTLDGHGDIMTITIFRFGTAPFEKARFHARLVANGTTIATVPLVDGDKIVFKKTDGSLLLKIDGPVAMVLRYDPQLQTGGDIDAINHKTGGFKIATDSFALSDGTTMADFQPFVAERTYNLVNNLFETSLL
ncbi:hypothetical protein HY627_02115 [Candidatus Uhrbacteria bacterium]|nr:hypothetical protein [Candidatus Uhrbacteria bacterium]